MKKVNFICSLVVIGFLLSLGNVYAVPFDPEWEELNLDPVATQTIDANTDQVVDGPAYFVWADDAARTSWHLYWIGDGSNTVYNFSGTFALKDNENAGSVTTVSFDHYSTITDTATVFLDDGTNQEVAYTDTVVVGGVSVTFNGTANTGYDGFDITLSPEIVPSLIGFDLFISGVPDIASQIYVGDYTLEQHPDNQDFAIAAPVPEPATMLLLGFGLIGIAGVSRKKLFKK